MKVYEITAPTPQGPAASDEQTFLMGVEFHEAAIRAGVTERDTGGAPVSALVPMIVNYAFAAELYLKSAARIGNTRPPVRGHKLHVLYGRLDDIVRADIASAYKAKTGREMRVLDADLLRLTDAFTDWRYVFEGAGKQVHVNLLTAFVQGTYAIIRTHRPDWSVRVDQDTRLRAPPQTLTMTVFNAGGGIFLHTVDGTPGGVLSTPEA